MLHGCPGGLDEVGSRTDNGPSVIAFETFKQQHTELGRDEFLAQIQEPYLLLIRSSTQSDSGSGFHTVKFTKEAVDQAAGGQANLIPVRKRADGNAFGIMITMGRASNNDLVIPNQKISKFHAYFRQMGSTWRISDANSRNGTFLNGVEVPKDQGTEIVSGNRIKLAKTVELIFFDPPGLYDHLHKV